MPEDKQPPQENGAVTCPRCTHEFDPNQTTTNSEMRWKWTGTILAILVVISLPALVLLAGFAVVSLGPITQGWWVLYATVVLMAATWTFGKETLQAVKEARGN
jgi:heme/copper-type cytochrome/quinol oxidase subunit 2